MARPPFSTRPSNPFLQPDWVMPPRIDAEPTEPEVTGASEPRRTLVVGPEIAVRGVIADAERLVVQGNIEADDLHARELRIEHGGSIKGVVHVEIADIAGTLDGSLTARDQLILRSSGQLSGSARYAHLAIEEGGRVNAQLDVMAGRADWPQSCLPALSPALQDTSTTEAGTSSSAEDA